MNTVSEEPVILAILLGVVLVRGGAAALVGQTTLKPSFKSMPDLSLNNLNNTASDSLTVPDIDEPASKPRRTSESDRTVGYI